MDKRTIEGKQFSKIQTQEGKQTFLLEKLLDEIREIKKEQRILKDIIPISKLSFEVIFEMLETISKTDYHVNEDWKKKKIQELRRI